jgi:predicted ATP-dependent Lon-type protease
MSWDFPDLKNLHSSSHYGVAMNFLEEALESMNDQINSQTNFEEQNDVRSSDDLEENVEEEAIISEEEERLAVK